MFTPWILKSSQGHVKSMILPIGYWLLKLVSGPLQFTPRKKCQSDHEVRGSQKIYVKAHIIHWHGPMDFPVGEVKRCFGRKRQGPIQRNFIIIYILGGKRRCRQKKTKENDQTWICLETILFEHVFTKISTFTFWCMVILFGPDSGLHLVRGPKTL